jgi:MATE family multidrug resistance protein
MGAGDPSYARNALACSGRIAFLYLSAVAATCLVFPEAIVSLFSGEEASGGVRREAAALVSLSGAFIVCDGFSLLFCGAARGAGDTLYIMKMTGGVSALQMALAALACLYGAGAGGLWLVLVLASFAKAALVFLRLSGGAWLTNVTAGSLFSEGSLSS